MGDRDVQRGKAVVAQPAQVGLEKGSEVGNAVFEHRYAVDAHAEGETLKFLRVEPGGAQHLRVYHPAAQDFEPVTALADNELVARAPAPDVHLGRGFGEGEV